MATKIQTFDKVLQMVREMRIDQTKRGVEFTAFEKKVDEQIQLYLEQGMFEIKK